jgi:hypothetical protein
MAWIVMQQPAFHGAIPVQSARNSAQAFGTDNHVMRLPCRFFDGTESASSKRINRTMRNADSRS